MTRRLNLFLAALILLIGVPFYWLLVDNRPGNIPAHAVDIAQLRRLAASLPGPAPTRVEMELVAYRRLPGDLLVAGSGVKRKLVGIMAFRLPVEGGKPVVIDSGIHPAGAAAMGLEQHNLRAQRRVDAAMEEAGLILITHEHPDHLGGLALHGGAALAGAARLNARQLPGNPLTRDLPWAALTALQPKLAPGGLQAVAPGVVVIPAASHTPGSQMIYVRLAGGREFLFAGDIASFAQNWEELRGRSRLVSTYVAPEDRAAVFGWLRTIRALKAAAPALVVVPGHDFEYLTDPLNPRGVRRYFGTAGDPEQDTGLQDQLAVEGAGGPPRREGAMAPAEGLPQ